MPLVIHHCISSALEKEEEKKVAEEIPTMIWITNEGSLQIGKGEIQIQVY